MCGLHGCHVFRSIYIYVYIYIFIYMVSSSCVLGLCFLGFCSRSFVFVGGLLLSFFSAGCKAKTGVYFARH